MPATVELSVVLPCLNEAETLETCIRKAQKSMSDLGIDGEVVVADNGSTDGSIQIAHACGARVVDVAQRGYGAALRTGIAAARGEFVIMADADDSYALHDLGPFVAALREGADLVMGNRFAGGIAPGAMPPLHRYLGNPVLSRLGRLMFRVPVGDFHCGMRAFRRSAIEKLGLRTMGMEFASEMVVRAALDHLEITEVPTTLRPDGRSRAPHLHTWRDGWRHLRFLLAMSPSWLFLYPASVLFALGFIGTFALAGGPITIGSVSFDVETMMASGCAMIVGLQMALLAMVCRTYATRIGLMPPNRRLEDFLEKATLEWGLVGGALLVIVGVILFIAALINWQHVSYGHLSADAIRIPLIGLILVCAGVLLIGASFMLSLSRIGEGNS